MPPKPSRKRTRVSSSKEEISAHVLVDYAILSKTRATRIREEADREKIQVPQRA